MRHEVMKFGFGFLLFITLFPTLVQAQNIGFGKDAIGGTGNPVCLVNNVLATGPGSFSDCARRGNVIVQFSSPGPYLVDGQQTYLKSNTTIDGCANGQNGVTLNSPGDIYRGVIVEGPSSNFIFRCLRFQGDAKAGGLNEHDLLALDGTNGAIDRVMVDRCTFNKATDGGIDIVGNVTNVTVRNSLIYSTPLASLIKYGTKSRLTFYHNIWSYNCERNPQIKGDVNGFEFLNNIVGPDDSTMIDLSNNTTFHDCYGGRFWAANSTSDAPGNPKGNVLNNIFLGVQPLILQVESGANLNNLFLSGNQGTQTCIGTCVLATSPNPVSSGISLVSTDTLKGELGTVGSPNKLASDLLILSKLATVLGSPTPVPTPTPNPNPTPTPIPTTKPIVVISNTCSTTPGVIQSDGTTKLTETCIQVVK
jgi:hypothetical protein